MVQSHQARHSKHDRSFGNVSRKMVLESRITGWPTTQDVGDTAARKWLAFIDLPHPGDGPECLKCEGLNLSVSKNG